MECAIEFDNLGLKYKERFNKSLTVVFETEIAFDWITFNDLSRPTILQLGLFQGYIGPKKFKSNQIKESKLKELIQF